MKALIGDRGKERREVDGSHRLRAEHKRIITQAFAVNLRLQRQRAEAVEACLRTVFDAAVEQVHGGQIARILQRPP